MPPDKPKQRVHAPSFAMGVVVTLGLVFLGLVFLGVQLGFGKFASSLTSALTDASRGRTSRVIDIPAGVLAELTEMGAVFDNAGNPTGAKKHDTIVTKLDEARGFVLRPGSKIDAYMLRARNRMNLDPPVLHLPMGHPTSSELRRFLEEQARVHYVYSIGADGYRLNAPDVRAERKILMVGDSVAFGVGVGDADNLASALQRSIGDSIQIVNAGVGGYSGEQALETAAIMAETQKYEALIYLTSQNDFVHNLETNGVARADRLLADFAKLKERFSNRIVVLVVGWIDYTIDDVLAMQSRGSLLRRPSAELFGALPKIASKNGFAYVDSLRIADDYTRDHASILARFALYVDRTHLSRVGNQLAAGEVSEVLAEWGLMPPRREPQ